MVTCCQDHVINQSPDNPAGTLVTYCTDCQVGPEGIGIASGTCGDRYIKAFTQDPTPTPTPPLFGRAPLGALDNLPTLEQVPTTTPAPPTPLGENTNVPPSGGAEQPPTPLPPPPTITPEITQDENNNNNGGGGLPSIKDKENIPLDNEIIEQPEDDEQEEGAETAGPLT